MYNSFNIVHVCDEYIIHIVPIGRSSDNLACSPFHDIPLHDNSEVSCNLQVWYVSVCVYVGVYVCVCVCTCVCACAHECFYALVCVYVCARVCVHACMHAFVCLSV